MNTSRRVLVTRGLAVIALLLSGFSAKAQTLKWTHTLTAPTGIPYNIAFVQHARTDAAGNLGLIIDYYNGTTLTGTRILWLSKRGKLLHSAEFLTSSGFRSTEVIRVTARALLTKLSTGGATVLRRYRLRGTTITETDTVLNTNEFLPYEPDDGVFQDSSGFIVFEQTQSGNITAIKRYTVL